SDLTNPDTDNDLMPDAWETSNFGDLSATATGDADLDGLNNLGEYLFGGDPKNPASGRPATSVESAESGFVFSFPTLAGRVYQPQVSTDLAGWSNLGSPIIGDGSTKSATDPTTGSKRFYRISVSLQ
ncbi:MAG: hypothetical protein ACOYMS_10485, partial [Terrimicrobiaceae bacterium]